MLAISMQLGIQTPHQQNSNHAPSPPRPHSMRYTAYLALYLVVQLLTYLITPALPLFAGYRHGKLDNAKGEGEALRLPLWLSWFDTPDNPLIGDQNWFLRHPKCTYLNQVMWLYRNSLYGLKWTVLARDVEQVRWVQGNPNIGYQGSRFGTLSIRQSNGAWQFKIVKPILGKIFEGNFGWLLDDTTKQRALFMFSPRIKRIKND